MTANDDIIDHANKLMRRRVFVASGAQPPSPPPVVEPPTPVDTDDLPVLTEIVNEEAPAVAAEPVEPVIPQTAIDARAAEMLAARLPFQRQAMADELTAWLDRELPQVVMHVVDGLTDRLVEHVTEAAKAALLPKLQDALDAEEIHIGDVE